MIHDAGFRSAIDSELGKEPVLLETFDDKPREDSAIEMQSNAAADDKGPGSNSEEFASSPPDVGNPHDPVEESQVVDQVENTAMDMDDAGFQMDDADDDFVMNDQNGQAGDDSDDGVPLPRNDTAKRHNNELPANETASAKADEKPDSQPSQQTASQMVKQEPGQQKVGEGEAGKSFQSTTVRGNTRSFTEPALLDDRGYDDYDDDDASSEYSDAHSTVPNPFYERDMAAMKREKAKARTSNEEEEDPPIETPPFNMPKSNQEANNVTDHIPGSVEKNIANDKIDFDLSFLDDNKEESEDSDVDFPDIEVLWASTAPTQKEFPPIKMESEAASQMPNSTADREASLPSVRQSSVHNSSIQEPVSAAVKDTPAVAQQKQPEPNQQQSVSESSSRDSKEPVIDDKNNNADNETQSPSSFLPDLDFGGSQHDTNDNADNDSEDQYQHSADNSSHPDFQPQDQQEESQDHAIPMVDLTVSSPLVSPDDSEDEDFAKSHRLPRGPGWVMKNVPGTRRQTRSSTGGGIVLSSSVSPPPARRRGGGRSVQSQY